MILQRNRLYSKELILLLLVVNIDSIFKFVNADTQTYINCFASLPSSFVLNNEYQYQSSAYCNAACSALNYAYFALSNHSKCYCGNDDPSSSSSTSDSCDASCYGYSQEMCGGSDSFSVYQLGDGAVSGKGSSSSSSSSSSVNVFANGGSSSSSSPASSSSSRAVSTLSPTSSSSSSSNAVLGALAGGASSSSVSTDSSSSEAQSSSTNSDDNVSPSTYVSVGTSVIYSTQYVTQGGSTIFKTNTITTVAASATASSSLGDSSSKNMSGSKKSNTGAIVGGVVGGVGGAIAITIIILFIVRHFNKKKEEERMEKEYQEAIKPVEYNGRSNSVLSKNTNDHIVIGTGQGFNKSNSDYYSSSISSQNNDNDNGSNNAYFNEHNDIDNGANTNNAIETQSVDPFDDSRRISLGSIFDENPNGNSNGKILTIVNPDEDD
ncbi:hypothetical protein TPHA_0C01600 [Tetrapisispora phaffii CBS 4417]|uniref:WSC domain-containing protein n=1 Tax=Tetrapisispora phaffii (strain ATCC 24235 / CBS 4417 / NBRC 1672 / NRRL Y-8282 / UCD 70-5) TaxID=1071381 RepID=G8BRE0_TETPH|nr:hypothetical protein TPHA_0C01600 [Tetrapisispora phaffii CBS 4417]CCE62316.1 hypothetical protein TPHA_0C01600 [Tetrapisispora phaffii CBS 4417]